MSYLGIERRKPMTDKQHELQQSSSAGNSHTTHDCLDGDICEASFSGIMLELRHRLLQNTTAACIERAGTGAERKRSNGSCR